MKKPKQYPTFGLTHKRIPVTMEFLLSEEGQKLLRPPGIEEILSDIEVQARRVLRDHGLNENYLEHITKTPDEFPDVQAFYATAILSHLVRALEWIAKNNAKMASREIFHMMRAVMDSTVTVLEPDIYRGKHSLKNATKGGKQKAALNEKNRLKWQRMATDIWKKNTKLSVRQVAALIAKKTGEVDETIRRHIKNTKKSG